MTTLSRARLVTALGFLNLSMFTLAVTFLPRRSVYSYSDPVSAFVNARTDWDLAWGTLAASLSASVAVYLLFAPRRNEPGDSR